MTRRTTLRVLALTVGVALLLAACGRAPTQPPEARQGLFITPASVTVNANETVEFTFEAAGLPAGLSAVTFEWNFGDGTTSSTGSAEVEVTGNTAVHTISYTFIADGAFGVWVSVMGPAATELYTGHVQAVVGNVTDLERDYDLGVCANWVAADAGGHGITVDYWDISTIPTGATFDMQFDALLQPDRYLIEYPEGTLVHDTGWRGSSAYEGSPLYPGGIAGPGLGSVPELFVKGSADTFKVTIIGGEPGTIWDYAIMCSTN